MSTELLPNNALIKSVTVFFKVISVYISYYQQNTKQQVNSIPVTDRDDP
jgi:hypothetical protein